MDITLKQGDSDTLTETITGLDSLATYSAKLYIKAKNGVALDTIEGTIDALTVTYEIVNEHSKLYAVTTYAYETKIWDGSDHVYTTSYGDFIVQSALENDPA